ncbi:cytochrome P450 [Atractiella rhizophila]|nr:cytochrome P450 [Atractiella rhizophila]
MLPLPLYPLIFVALYWILPYLLDKHSLRSIPGPFWAKFSNLWLARWARVGKRYEAVEKAHREYGTYVRIAPNNCSIADPDAIPIVYGHGTGTLKSDFYDAFVSIQRGLFNTRSRDDHSRKRKIVSGVFAQRNVLEFEPYIRDVVRQLLNKWDGLIAKEGEAKKGWAEFDCLPWYNYLAFDIIGDLAFGSLFGMVEREADYAHIENEDGSTTSLPAVKILNERGEFSATQGVLPPFIRPYTKYIDPWFNRGQKSVSNLAGIARSRVNERLAEGGGDRKDLLSLLQNAKDGEGNPMAKGELTAEALTQLIAGSDTTSNSSCAITYYLASNPRVQEKLQKELDEAFKGKGVREVVEYEDCKDLPYLAACINEALRRHSTSAIGLPRLMTETTTFKGHVFPPGTVLSVPSYTIHHLDSVWGDPWNYRPERWIENGKELEQSFVPFGYGPRSCVGRNLATLELTVFMATLFYRYEFKLKDPNMGELQTSEGFLRKPLELEIGIRRRNVE